MSVYTENSDVPRTNVLFLKEGKRNEGGNVVVWIHTLKEKMESTRKKMEEAAMTFGLNHPKVYELSLELDYLHNQWERACLLNKKESERLYTLRTPIQQIKESPQPQNVMQAI